AHSAEFGAVVPSDERGHVRRGAIRQLRACGDRHTDRSRGLRCCDGAEIRHRAAAVATEVNTAHEAKQRGGRVGGAAIDDGASDHQTHRIGTVVTLLEDSDPAEIGDETGNRSTELDAEKLPLDIGNAIGGAAIGYCAASIQLYAKTTHNRPAVDDG